MLYIFFVSFTCLYTYLDAPFALICLKSIPFTSQYLLWQADNLQFIYRVALTLFKNLALH